MLFTGVNGSGIQLTFTIAPGGPEETTTADAMQKIEDSITACSLTFVGPTPEQTVLTSSSYCPRDSNVFLIPDGK